MITLSLQLSMSCYKHDDDTYNNASLFMKETCEDGGNNNNNIIMCNDNVTDCEGEDADCGFYVKCVQEQSEHKRELLDFDNKWPLHRQIL